MTKKEFLDNLTEIGKVCTDRELSRIRDLCFTAQEADRAAIKNYDQGIAHARLINKGDTVARMQRNTASLSYLLSMAYDVADSIKHEVSQILIADNEAQKTEKEKRDEIIKKMTNKKYHTKS